jgi:hypothetical protein
MANRKRGVLWVATITIALIAAAVQIMLFVVLWSQFDTRVSCERTIYWNEWLACMHGQSHLHVVFAELSIAAWAIAGIVGSLGRFLPPYISFVFPAGIVIALAVLLIAYWNEWTKLRTVSLSDILYFTINAGLFVLVSLGPSASAWLLALHKRKDHARPQLSTVFE